MFELPRFRQAFAELVRDMPDDPEGFRTLLGMLYEYAEDCPEITFQRVLE